MERNKKVRLYYMGKRQKDIYLNKTKWQIFVLRVKTFFKVLFWGIMVVLFLTGIFEAGSYLNPKTIYTKQEVIKEVDTKAPVLDRIAQAESLNSHYCTEKLVTAKMCAKSELGQVLLRANKNGTVDIGRYQINNYYWGAKATEQGLSLFIEKDNEKMALWIFKNYGSEPWESSSKKW